MERWNGKVAVVTGASSGIGEAVAKKLVGNGMKVLALARRQERLQKLEKECSAGPGTLKGLQCDVTKEDEVKEAFKWVDENWGPVQVIINNAAVLLQTPLTNLDLSTVSQSLNTNVLGTVTSLKYGLESMQKHSINGHVIIINSVAGHMVVPMPGISTYCASKHAVKVITESLRNELSFANSKIRVTSISPGLVDTEMVGQFREHMVSDTPILRAGDIADCVAFALSAPQHVTISELVVQPTGESTTKAVAVIMKNISEMVVQPNGESMIKSIAEHLK
uniref:Putative dehydrogenase n=1 Tax=Panstrongylus lignarius TaxID=156445 RepID=A0A224XQ51_9HEMI